jgi:CheY-like chemotaxis protein
MSPNSYKPHRRVLVVDDNLEFAQSFAMLVERIIGHKVEFAINGYAALQVAKKLKPEIAFVDLMMPGLSGFEVARRLKKEFGDGIRVIAVTAHDNDEGRRKAAKVGCELHLTKPLAPQVIEGLFA